MDIARMFRQYWGSAFCTVSLKQHIDLINNVGLTIEHNQEDCLNQEKYIIQWFPFDDRYD